MPFAKRLFSLILTAALGCSLLTGCAGSEATTEYDLPVRVGSAPSSLDPIYAQDPGDQTILAHLYENLMRVSVNTDGTTTVVGGMAKDVELEQNPDGSTTYTFRLRGAEWSDGRDVEAGDFVYAWQRLIDPASSSPFASLLSMVAGYDEARASGDLSLLQVEAKNDSTLVVTLNGNYNWFLTEVCTATATMPLRSDVVATLKTTAAEKTAAAATDDPNDEDPLFRWWSEPTELVTNGPYQAVTYDHSALTARKYGEYYRDITGPHDLTFHFTKSVEDAQALYDSSVVDAVWPLSDIQMEALAATEGWTSIPELCTYSVLFNGDCEALADPLVRQAMHLVIDRNLMAQLAGITAVPAEGVVPPGVPCNEDGTYRQIYGSILSNDPELYADRCTQANDLLDQAGYDSGANLEAIEYLYVVEGRNTAVANALCDLWNQTLQLQVTPIGVSEEEFWTIIRSGDYDLAGAHLDALSNDAECFLRTWTSSNPDNFIAYKNSAYDTLLQIIATAEDGVARMGCLHDAEVLLLEDHVIAPLYTLGTDWLLREPHAGAYRDPRGWFFFADTLIPTT